MPRPQPVLTREGKPLPTGHVKVTQQDWLATARDVLIRDGAGEVKILTLAQHLGVSRSSFYWYFGSRADLLEALLDDWEARNTAPILHQCTLPSDTITEGLCNFFMCFVDDTIFEPHLDFAIREWSRRDARVRGRIDAADTARLAAVTGMFRAHGYNAEEADIRARILYFMQIGYHALELREAMETRMGRLAGFLEHFTGRAPSEAEIADFTAFALKVAQR
ncbi:TetR/AcrR family transcriptional regulator [Hasllibacter sp. MH4015]|uniref:TetR/AcrR family transcriptional regulator n=1 Tax=Hasllibacter sp. MH4015 TaxID=2854029 RepID=UPI001CD3653F|nr:TetR/AcrR family transcriptional regulator [Hasllibacter sp. MH4015]